MKRKIRTNIAFLLLIASVLSGCGSIKEPSEIADATNVLTIASVGSSSSLKGLVNEFNESHSEMRIEITEYARSENEEEDGILLLQREIASGEGPDLIDFGDDFTTEDIVGEYTEDLWPFIEGNISEYFANIFDTFSYKGKLLAVPLSVSLKSFVGRTSRIGDATSWTIAEMMQCYREQEGITLYPGAIQMDVLGTILEGSMEEYIDWESGDCSFDGEAFRTMLAFCNEFPNTLDLDEDFSVKKSFAEDTTLLLPISISNEFDVYRAECIFDEEDVTFIGFPTDGASGTMLQTDGPVLAISIGSTNKEAASEFIRWCLSEETQKALGYGIPVNRNALDNRLQKAMTIEYATNEEGDSVPVSKAQILFDGEEAQEIYAISQESAEDLRELMENVNQSSQTNSRIRQIVLEEAAYYFNGDKSLEAATDSMQSRARLYVSERIS